MGQAAYQNNDIAKSKQFLNLISVQCEGKIKRRVKDLEFLMIEQKSQVRSLSDNSGSSERLKESNQYKMSI